MSSLKLQTVERALIVLEMISQRPQTLKEIQTELNLDRTTTSRLIASLMERGYIERDPATSIYSVGLKVVHLASEKLNQLELQTEASPLLQELSYMLNQVCHMGILTDGKVCYVDKVQPQSPIPLISYIGKLSNIHSTALGKVLVSELSDTKITALLETVGMESQTKHTITSIDGFLNEIRQVRANGFALDREENEENVWCVAAPIRDYRSHIIAAISTSGPKPIDVEKIIEPLRTCALKISKRIGYDEYTI